MAHEADDEDSTERNAAAELADDGSDFVGLMQHFYRGEIGRTTAWRARLDRTTNWAVGLMATLITWAFSAADRPHYIILGSLAIVTLFLIIEARRYRIYDIWRSRVRLVEEHIFANAAAPEGTVQEGWRRLLANDLRDPTLKVPLLEALSRRLRRVYFPLITTIVVSWVFRVTFFAPGDVGIWEATSIGSLPGLIVVTAVGTFYATIVAITAWPMDRLAKGEKRGQSERREGWREE